MTDELLFDLTGETDGSAAVFARRNIPHERMLAAVTRFFVGRGCVVQSIGQELLPLLFHEQIRRWHDDLTSRFLRFRPDLAVADPAHRRTHLCEVKSETDKYGDGPNHSLQLESLEICRLLEDAGLSVLYVFDGLSACRPSAVVFHDRWDDPRRLASIRDGSRTKFGLFRKSSPFLRPLEQFAREELGL